MTRKTNQAGVDLIKHFEDLVNFAYRDAVGVWTIGYGHTKDVRDGQHVTDAEAEQLLRQDLADAEDAVNRLVKVDLNDNQFSALVSFVFNLGEGNFAKSTMLKDINAGDFEDVPDELRKWNKAGGKVLNGLVRRREAEAKLWSTPC